MHTEPVAPYVSAHQIKLYGLATVLLIFALGLVWRGDVKSDDLAGAAVPVQQQIAAPRVFVSITPHEIAQVGTDRDDLVSLVFEPMNRNELVHLRSGDHVEVVGRLHEADAMSVTLDGCELDQTSSTSSKNSR